MNSLRKFLLPITTVTGDVKERPWFRKRRYTVLPSLQNLQHSLVASGFAGPIEGQLD